MKDFQAAASWAKVTRRHRTIDEGNTMSALENKFENRILGEPTLSSAELLDSFVDGSGF